MLDTWSNFVMIDAMIFLFSRTQVSYQFEQHQHQQQQQVQFGELR